MSGQIKLREPGRRAFPADDPPQLMLVPSQKPNRPDMRAEMSDEGKERPQKMNNEQVRRKAVRVSG